MSSPSPGERANIALLEAGYDWAQFRGLIHETLTRAISEAEACGRIDGQAMERAAAVSFVLGTAMSRDFTYQRLATALQHGDHIGACDGE